MPADRSVMVRLRANVHDFNRNIATSSAAVGTLESRLRAADRDGGAAIDRLSGRIGLLADALITIGPAAIPISAVAVPAVTTLASSLGFVTLSAGTAAVAFGGVGIVFLTVWRPGRMVVPLDFCRPCGPHYPLA